MRMKGFDPLINAVAAIKSDTKLRSLFVQILSGADSASVRVAALTGEL